MNIYVVRRPNPSSDGEVFYDALHGYVCISKDEQAARKLGMKPRTDDRPEIWLNKDKTICERIGTADDSTEQIVLMDVCNG